MAPTDGNEWFESWFNSPYYHLLYQHRDSAEAQSFINNLHAHLDLQPGARVLDLACGIGRHSVYLNKLGFDVTGVDLSEESIAKAQEYSNETLTFEVRDMCEPFGTAAYDVIFNLFTSFGYFSSNNANIWVLKNVKAALRPNGAFILDFLNAEKVLAELENKKQETQNINGIEFHTSKRIEGDCIIKEINITDVGKQHRFVERVQAIKLDDFKALFNAVGMQITELFGDYNLTPFEVQSSDRLILLATAGK